MRKYRLIGAGGTGTHILSPLINYLISYHARKSDHDDAMWQLGIIDGDVVEPHNLERQLFTPDTIQMSKAKAAIRPYEHMHNIVGIAEYLGPDNIEQLIPEDSIIMIAVDNFPVRANIERHVNTLDNAVVINAGNEVTTGSCQIWIRKNGQNITPPISFLHPEILAPGEDRSAMTCAQVALLPGGEQTIVANMSAAMWMLTALIRVHDWLDNGIKHEETWTELQFDLEAGTSVGIDNRLRRGWA